MPRPKAPSDPNSYEAVHYRLYGERGKARGQKCIVPDCESVKTEWAWQHVGESASGIDYRGRPRTWGLDISTYAPMCRSHHHMIDQGGTLTHCPRGHDRSLGRIGGQCVGCRREDVKAWRARR